MVSTQTWDSASALLSSVFTDIVDIHMVGEVETTGVTATRKLTRVAKDVPALVQTLSLPIATGGISQFTYSIKVPAKTVLEPGMAVDVLVCHREPALVGRLFLVESVSENGLALLRKAIATDYRLVDVQGGLTK